MPTALVRTRRCRRATAFTLIEVLVVVAIIALLIAILIPSLKQAREISKRILCVSNLHQQGIGMMAYAHDHKGLLPQRGYFHYYMKEPLGSHVPKEWIVPQDPNREFGAPVGPGMLWGKYSGKDLKIFYCPDLIKKFGEEPIAGPQFGMKYFPIFNNVDFNRTFMGYTYDVVQNQTVGAPWNQSTSGLVLPTPSPRATGKDPYPKDTWDIAYANWLDQERNGARTTTAKKPPDWVPQGSQTLECDALVNGGALLHDGGISALFTDLHAKFVKDMIVRDDYQTKGTAPFIAGRYNVGTGHNMGVADNDMVYDVWIYLTRHQ